MRHISEVLRLAAQGLSQREICSSLGISRTSVRNYLARAKHAGLQWPLPEHLDEAVIEAQLFKRTDAGVRLVGGGGTDMRVGIETAEASRPAPHVVIVLTDGYPVA